MQVNDKKKVYGIGNYSKGQFQATHKGISSRHYKLWQGMLKRATKRLRTYVDCTVDERFLDFQVFAEWANAQVGFSNPSFQLDKDILIQGNKVYSPEACSFVPSIINNMFYVPKSFEKIDHLPTGICLASTGHYEVRCSRNGQSKRVGTFVLIEDALYAYKESKEASVKETAMQYRGQISESVFQRLMAWEFDFYGEIAKYHEKKAAAPSIPQDGQKPEADHG